MLVAYAFKLFLFFCTEYIVNVIQIHIFSYFKVIFLTLKKMATFRGIEDAAGSTSS